MYYISKEIPQDCLPLLATLFNMTNELQAIQADQSKSKSAGLQLLYQWGQAKAGVRQKLVEALKELDLLQLALM